MTEPITVADLGTIGDIAAQLVENVDALPTEQAIEMLVAARKAQLALKLAVDMLEYRALHTIEGRKVVVGNTVFWKAPQFKMRPDQELIRHAVASRTSAPDENGEIPTPFDAAKAATETMAALYVSPSTTPKVGGVRSLGLTLDDVCREEHTGFELKQKEVE